VLASVKHCDFCIVLLMDEQARLYIIDQVLNDPALKDNETISIYDALGDMKVCYFYAQAYHTVREK
jgi:hypothetical protein